MECRNVIWAPVLIILYIDPFHLCSVEVPLTVAQCVLYNESHGHPKKYLTSECIAIAKKDIKAGEIMDGIG